MFYILFTFHYALIIQDCYISTIFIIYLIKYILLHNLLFIYLPAHLISSAGISSIPYSFAHKYILYKSRNLLKLVLAKGLVKSTYSVKCYYIPGQKMCIRIWCWDHVLLCDIMRDQQWLNCIQCLNKNHWWSRQCFSVLSIK